MTCVSLCACAVSSGRDPDLTATAAAGTRRPERIQCRHHPEQRSGAQAARARGRIAAIEGHPTLPYSSLLFALPSLICGGLQAGWLLKKRDILSGWRCRYFVVYKGRVEYYVDQV